VRDTGIGNAATGSGLKGQIAIATESESGKEKPGGRAVTGAVKVETEVGKAVNESAKRAAILSAIGKLRLTGIGNARNAPLDGNKIHHTPWLTYVIF